MNEKYEPAGLRLFPEYISTLSTNGEAGDGLWNQVMKSNGSYL